MKAARYIGPNFHRELGGRHLKPGDLVVEPPALIDSLLGQDDFEEVDTSATIDDKKPSRCHRSVSEDKE